MRTIRCGYGQTVTLSVVILLELCFGLISAKWSGNIHNGHAEEWRKLFQDHTWHLDDGGEAVARQWLEQTNEEMSRRINILVHKEWGYQTNLTDVNAKEWDAENVRMALWLQKQKKVASSLQSDAFDPDIKRQLKLFKATSADPTDEGEVLKLSGIMSRMQGIFGKAKVCPRESKCLSLNPELENIMDESRDPDKLKWAWLAWRDATGPKIKKLHEDMTYLQNIGARENGYEDTGVYWRLQNYEAPDIEPIVDRLYEEIKPMYLELYIYVRRKLIEEYRNVLDIKPDGPIPAHLLGNMWAQEWTGIYDLVTPFPEASNDDVTGAMLAQGYTPMRMFKMAEEFFSSIGLYKMTPVFWEKSIIVKPTDREIQCHASASDFHTTDDWRIKMCTKINQVDLETVHHEMGHIEYYMAYSLQPDIYRAAANTAFHEAVGDTISLSVNSRKHLKTVGLLDDKDTDDEEKEFKQSINGLMTMALAKIALLPFGYLVDKWRWGVYEGKITPDNYNRAWWEMRLKYQGLVPPAMRSERDFDPASKYHISTNTPYIRYFISFIAQFQFYEALCIESDHVGPLHQCDFYRSQKAGKKLKDMLTLGFSKPWPEAMKVLTGQSEINTSSIQRYFKPLMDWLIEQNRDEPRDWLPADRTVQSVVDEFFE